MHQGLFFVLFFFKITAGKDSQCLAVNKRSDPVKKKKKMELKVIKAVFLLSINLFYTFIMFATFIKIY